VEHVGDDDVVADGVYSKGHEEGREVVILEIIFRKQVNAVEQARFGLCDTFTGLKALS